jgi:hypothetical protein
MIVHITAEHADRTSVFFTWIPTRLSVWPQADLAYLLTLGQWGMVTVTPSGTYGLEPVGIALKIHH